jgi:molecular chaperone DnaJ
MAKDYYQTLGINPEASIDDIKKAYRKLAHKYHPDKSDGNEQKFKEVNEAYEVLSDPQKRSSYDQFGKAGFEQQQSYGPGFGQGQGFEGFDFGQGGQGFSFDMGDIFDMFFGREQQSRRRPQRGSDIEKELEINFSDAFFSKNFNLEIQRQEKCSHCRGNGAESGTKIVTCPQCKGKGQVEQNQQTVFGQFTSVISCPTCHGEGKIAESPCKQCNGQGIILVNKRVSVNIPPGVDNGNVLRVPGEGNVGEKGTTPGDLLLLIKVRPHKIFERKGDNIYIEIPISFINAALGTEITIPTPDGGEERLKIPAGTQPDEALTLKGRGMPLFSQAGFGDLEIKIKIKTPTRLSKEEKELLEQLAILEKEKPNFWQKIRDKF